MANKKSKPNIKKYGGNNLLYKYCSINTVEKLRRIIDIIIYEKLYAANFTQMNDPMEGVYRYSEKTPKEIRDMIKWKKLDYGICALSKKHNNTLMWTHYADSHHGIALGVKPCLNKKDYDLINVDYIDDVQEINIKNSIGTRKTAKNILSKKLKPWEYEEEIRVLTKKQHVPIKIKEVLIGCKTDENEVERIKFLFKGTVNEKKIRQLRRDELDVSYE